MSGNIGNLVANLSVDTSQFVAPIQQAAAAAEQSGERVIRIIHQQETSWGGMAQAVVPAIGQVTSSALDLSAAAVEASSHNIFQTMIDGATTAAATMAGVIAANVAIAASSQAAGVAVDVIHGAWDRVRNMSTEAAITAAAAAGVIIANWRLVANGAVTLASNWRTGVTVLETGGGAFLRYGGIAARVAGSLIPQWRLVTTAVGASLLIYKVASSDMAASASKALAASESMGSSWTRLTTAAGKLGSIAKQPFGDMRAGAESLIKAMNPLPTVVGWIAPIVASGMTIAANAVVHVQKEAQVAADVFSTALYVSSSWGSATAESTQKFYEEAGALRALAAETERVIALQERQKPLFQQLGQMQQEASESARRAQQLAEIGHLTTIEDIDKEIRRQQELQRIAIQNGTFNAAHAKDTFNALARQKEGVESGRITEDTVKDKDNPILKQIQDAQRALDTLEHGAIQVAVDAAAKAGGSAEYINTLRGILERTQELTAANAAQKASEQALQQQQQKAAQMQEQAADRINKTRDQIDLLTGSATKADIAMREMSRQGFDADQIAEIAEAEAELAKLQKKKDQKHDQHNKAAFQGTAEAASIVLRGVAKPQGQDKQIALATTANASLGKIAASIDKGLSIEIEEVTLT